MCPTDDACVALRVQYSSKVAVVAVTAFLHRRSIASHRITSDRIVCSLFCTAADGNVVALLSFRRLSGYKVGCRWSSTKSNNNTLPNITF